MSEEPPHAETIAYRMNTLGWSEQRARATPIRKKVHQDGRTNIAKTARSLDATPSRVQSFVRQGFALDDAIEMAWEVEGKL